MSKVDEIALVNVYLGARIGNTSVYRMIYEEVVE